MIRFEKMRQTGAELQEIWLLLARMYRYAGRYDEAWRALEFSRFAGPVKNDGQDLVEGLLLLGDEERYYEGIMLLRQVEERTRGSSSGEEALWTLAGITGEGISDANAVIAAYSALATGYPVLDDPMETTLVIGYRGGGYQLLSSQQALIDLRRYQKLYPDNPRAAEAALLEICCLAFDLDRPEEALKRIDETGIIHNSELGQKAGIVRGLILGWLMARTDDGDAALMQTVIPGKPLSAASLLFAGLMNQYDLSPVIDAGQFARNPLLATGIGADRKNRALSRYRGVQALPETDGDRAWRAEALFQRALLLLDSGHRLEEADTCLSLIRDNYRESPRARDAVRMLEKTWDSTTSGLVSRGYVAYSRGDTIEAQRLLESAAARTPDMDVSRAMLMLASLQRFEAGEPRMALDTLQRYMNSFSNLSSVELALLRMSEIALEDLRDYELGERYLRKALIAESRAVSVEATTRLASLLVELERSDEAVELLRVAAGEEINAARRLEYYYQMAEIYSSAQAQQAVADRLYRRIIVSRAAASDLIDRAMASLSDTVARAMRPEMAKIDIAEAPWEAYNSLQKYHQAGGTASDINRQLENLIKHWGDTAEISHKAFKFRMEIQRSQDPRRATAAIVERMEKLEKLDWKQEEQPEQQHQQEPEVEPEQQHQQEPEEEQPEQQDQQQEPEEEHSEQQQELEEASEKHRQRPTSASRIDKELWIAELGVLAADIYLTDREDPENARIMLERVYRENTGSARAMAELGLARLEREEGEYDRALRHIRSAQEFFPLEAANLGIKVAFRNLNDRDLAAEFLPDLEEEQRELFERQFEALDHIDELRAEIDDGGPAIELFRRIARIQESRLDDPEAVIRAWESCVEAGDQSPNTFIRLGDLYRQAGNPDRALARYSLVNPDSAEVFVRANRAMSRIFLDQRGDISRALHHLAVAAEADDGTNLADIAIDMISFPHGRQRLDEVLEQREDSDSTDVRLAQATALARSGYHRAAIERLRDLPEDHPGVLLALGRAHMALGDAARASAHFDRVMEIEPALIPVGSPEWNLAVTAGRRGELEPLLRKLDEETLGPGVPPVLLQIAVKLETELQDWAGARRYYTELVDVFPDSPEAEPARISLNRLDVMRDINAMKEELFEATGDRKGLTALRLAYLYESSLGDFENARYYYHMTSETPWAVEAMARLKNMDNIEEAREEGVGWREKLNIFREDTVSLEPAMEYMRRYKRQCSGQSLSEARLEMIRLMIEDGDTAGARNKLDLWWQPLTDDYIFETAALARQLQRAEAAGDLLLARAAEATENTNNPAENEKTIENVNNPAENEKAIENVNNSAENEKAIENANNSDDTENSSSGNPDSATAPEIAVPTITTEQRRLYNEAFECFMVSGNLDKATETLMTLERKTADTNLPFRKRLAEALKKEGRFAEAFNISEPLADSEPDLIARLRELLRLNRLQELSRRDPDNMVHRLRLGMLLRERDPSVSAEHLETYLKSLDPRRPLPPESLARDAMIALCEIYIEKEYPDQVMNWAMSLAARFPDDETGIDYQLSAADILLERGEYSSAASIYERILNTYPDYSQYRSTRAALASARLGDKPADMTAYQEARRRFRRIEPDQETLDRIEDLLEAVSLAPNHESSFKTLMDVVAIYEDELNDFESAARVLETVLSDWDREFHKKEVYLKLIRMYQVQLQKFDKAEEKIEQFIEQHPTSTEVFAMRMELADLYLRRNRFSESIELYERLAGEAFDAETRQKANFRAALVFEEKLYDYEEAIRRYLHAAESYELPLTPDCYFRIAVIYDRRLDEYQNAAQYYRRITEDYPMSNHRPTAQDALDRLEREGRI